MTGKLHVVEPAESEFLSIEELLALDDLPTLTLKIPEWGNKKITLSTLDAAARTAYVDASRVGDGMGGRRVDETLSQLNLFVAAFVRPTLTLEQAKAMQQKNGVVWDRIWTAILIHNRMDRASQAMLDAEFRGQPDAAPAV